MGTAFGACQFMLFEAQARPPRDQVKIDFIDVRPYAGELMCFALRCGDSDFNPDNPSETFSDMQRAGKLQIKSGRLPAWGANACANTLIVDPPYFCLDGENVRMEVSEPADYTGSGEQQALLKVSVTNTPRIRGCHRCRRAAGIGETVSCRAGLPLIPHFRPISVVIWVHERGPPPPFRRVP
ncbi:hypothetical protein AB1286_29030 [Trinickia sp. NRRL B-1857]|uniref:hypothetical protein n=1 Tax=Trinickia sp. NRRL B-1857 TaxID=3162879 RepID=UPI003D2BAE86